ncbi:MAG: flagellar basal body-associated FliL family protein [Magnetovibrionaceae bacterium]
MADDDLHEDDDFDDDEDEEGAPAKKGGKLKLIIFGVVGLVLLGGIGAGVMMFLGGDSDDDQPKAEVAIPVFHELPGMLVDLKTGRCRAPYLKITMVLTVLGQEGINRAKEVEPVLMDTVQAHLRDTEREELVGKAGADKLRADVLTIVNSALAPQRADSVLFKEFLLQ